MGSAVVLIEQGVLHVASWALSMPCKILEKKRVVRQEYCGVFNR